LSNQHNIGRAISNRYALRIAMLHREADLGSKMSKVKRSTLRTKVSKSNFTHVFVKSGLIYVKPRPKWSAVHSTSHIIEYVSSAEMLRVSDNL